MNTDPRRNPRRQPPANLPTITTAAGRKVACYPTMLHAVIVDREERILLFRRPGQTGWETVSGTLEPDESVAQAVLRGTKAAAGQQFLVTYLTVLDTFTNLLDANLPPFISICCLLRHRSGDLQPGRELRDAEFRWWHLAKLDDLDLAVPRGRYDLLTRAVDMSRFLRDAREPEEEDFDRRLDFP